MSSKKSYGAEFKEKFRKRASLVKEAKILLEQKEFANAAYKLQEYLSVIAIYHDVPVIDLTPEHFDPKKEVAEMLMITQVTWELLKIYEQVPKLKVQYEHCIELFVRFSINQPYQRLNSEIVRRYIRKSKATDRESLREAYKKISLKSRKCFIATYCYGDDHIITNNLRNFKFKLQTYPMGLVFINNYYRFSPKLIYFFDRKPILKNLLLPFIKMSLKIFEKSLRIFN